MSDTKRQLLCRYGSLFTRESVFQTADGLEVDSSEHHEIVRRRVFFDDVRLVTYHSDRDVWYLVATAVFGAIFTIVGMLIMAIGADAWRVALLFFIVAAPALVLFLIRMAFGRDNITVFGRRSMAVLRFSGLRRRRAREVYGQICATVRRAQASATRPEEPPPVNNDDPIPRPPTA